MTSRNVWKMTWLVDLSFAATFIIVELKALCSIGRANKQISRDLNTVDSAWLRLGLRIFKLTERTSILVTKLFCQSFVFLSLNWGSLIVSCLSSFVVFTYHDSCRAACIAGGIWERVIFGGRDATLFFRGQRSPIDSSPMPPRCRHPCSRLVTHAVNPAR